MPWIDIQNLVREDEPTEREKQQVIDFARRKAKPRFYADENFPELAIAILRRFKADVLTVRETGRRGDPDETHASEALRLGRVLITCDRDYLDERRFPLIHCPALVVFDFGRGTASEIIATFKCLGNIVAKCRNGAIKWLSAHAGKSAAIKRQWPISISKISGLKIRWPERTVLPIPQTDPP